MEYIFIEVINKEDTLLFCSVYRPNNNINFEPFIDKVSEISTLFSKIVIAGDFNSNILTKSRLTNCMTAIGLCPVNTSTPTHFTATSSSLIDIFFVSPECHQIFFDQISASFFSKHDLIYMVCDFSLKVTERKARYRDFKNMNFNLLCEEFHKIEWSIIYHMMSIADQ